MKIWRYICPNCGAKYFFNKKPLTGVIYSRCEAEKLIEVEEFKNNE